MLLIIFCVFSFFLSFGQSDISLPAVNGNIGMDLNEAIENRVASRKYDGKEIPLEVISEIMWAGYGITLKNGNKTVHGYDAISGATSKNRYSVPFGWGKPYLKIYLFLKKGVYEYLPESHKLKFLTDKNLIKASGTSASDPSGVIFIALDIDKMPTFGNDVMINNVAFMTAGSVSQNMSIAGAVHKIHFLTEISMSEKKIKNNLNLSKDIKPLTILPFGYSK